MFFDVLNDLNDLKDLKDLNYLNNLNDLNDLNDFNNLNDINDLNDLSWFPFVGAYLRSFSGHFYIHSTRTSNLFKAIAPDVIWTQTTERLIEQIDCIKYLVCAQKVFILLSSFVDKGLWTHFIL